MEQERLSDGFKRKVTRWEAARVFDRIAARVEEGGAQLTVAGWDDGGMARDSHN